MTMLKIASVPLMYQKSDGVCWYASARMLYKWSKATKRGAMKNPADDPGYSVRHANNGDVYAWQNNFLGKALNMSLHSSVTMECNSLDSFMAANGPIWTGLQKNWGGNNHGHVVVICGVADTGVFIHDPEPVLQGSSFWLTWSQINKAIAGMTDADPQFMTAV